VNSRDRKNAAQDLTRGPESAHLRRQAVPFAFGLVAIFSFEAFDLLFISKLGDMPLAAVSFTLPVIWLVYGIGIGFEAGAASCVSRAMGRGDASQAGRLTTDTVMLASGVSLLLCLTGLATIGPVFRLLGVTDNLLPLVRQYMHIWYWVAPLDVALWTMLASLRARGNSLLESKIITSAAILNLGLDPLFIFGLAGFPRMGVAGAAMATLIANATMLLLTTVYLIRRLHVFASPLAPFRKVLESWKHMLTIGVPAMMTNAIGPISGGIIVSMIAGYGIDSVAGFGIAMRIEPMALIPFYALSAVSSPFFGQNFSAGHFSRLLVARRAVIRFCLLFGLILAVIASSLARPLAGLYTDSPQISSVTTLYLWVVAWSWGAYGVVMSVNASFNGSGRPLPSVVISSCRVIIVFLPLAWLAQHWLGLPGLFAAETVSNALMGWVAYQWLGRHIRAQQVG